jgi:CheY-like chemotaxis protein
VGTDVVAALAHSAGLEVLRIGAIIGGDEQSGRALAAQLDELGYHTSWWATGPRGLGSLKAMAGVDLVIVDEKVSGLTPRQVINELRSEPRLARTQIYVKASSPDTDSSAFGDKVNGVLAPGEDLAAAAEAASNEPMNRDREEAMQLAARSAETLRLLAASGLTDVSAAADTLTGTLANRPDEVVIPALGVLQFVGGPSHVERIATVLSAADRSEPVRVQAAHALAGIFARSGTADEGVLKMLQDVAQKDAAFPIRAATAGALGRLNLTRDVRIELMRALLTR